jgi:hypothetical protein
MMQTMTGRYPASMSEPQYDSGRRHDHMTDRPTQSILHRASRRRSAGRMSPRSRNTAAPDTAAGATVSLVAALGLDVSGVFRRGQPATKRAIQSRRGLHDRKSTKRSGTSRGSSARYIRLRCRALSPPEAALRPGVNGYGLAGDHKPTSHTPACASRRRSSCHRNPAQGRAAAPAASRLKLLLAESGREAPTRVAVPLRTTPSRSSPFSASPACSESPPQCRKKVARRRGQPPMDDYYPTVSSLTRLLTLSRWDPFLSGGASRLPPGDQTRIGTAPQRGAAD